ncbi:MAG: inositol monophosphatase family protein [Pseudomonadota bacterium]|nr:MAG: inositol monophosphatase family protein [Pseudomonadota bacterium]
MLAELETLVRQAAAAAVPHPGSVAKPDGSIVTGADLAVQQFLVDALTDRWPGYPVLGEEMDEAAQRAALTRFGSGAWCIDPIDGTTNFATGFPAWAISVALIQDGSASLGIVYDPGRDECFTAQADAGARLNGTLLKAQDEVCELGACVAAIDFKRLAPDLACRLASEPPYRSQRNLGSVALDWCWLAAGRCQLYLHGGQRLWDYAAGALVLQEAGGAAWALDRKELYAPMLEARPVCAAANDATLAAWRGWLEM